MSPTPYLMSLQPNRVSQAWRVIAWFSSLIILSLLSTDVLTARYMGSEALGVDGYACNLRNALYDLFGRNRVAVLGELTVGSNTV